VASLLIPSLWEPLEKTTTFSKIAQGDLLTVSPAVEWQIQGNMEDPLYVAWIALVGNGQEEIPQEPSTLKRFRELLQCGQLACRNFHMAGHPKVCDERDPRSYVRLPFKAPGAPDKSLKMHLETVSHLPRKAKVWLATPPDMADSKGISADPPSEDGKPEDGLVYVPVNPSGRHYFRESVFERGSLAKLKLVIFIPREFRKNSYQISVRQICDDEEVGRVTWRISNADPRR